MTRFSLFLKDLITLIYHFVNQPYLHRLHTHFPEIILHLIILIHSQKSSAQHVSFSKTYVNNYHHPLFSLPKNRDTVAALIPQLPTGYVSNPVWFHFTKRALLGEQFYRTVIDFHCNIAHACMQASKQAYNASRRKDNGGGKVSVRGWGGGLIKSVVEKVVGKVEYFFIESINQFVFFFVAATSWNNLNISTDLRAAVLLKTLDN